MQEKSTKDKIPFTIYQLAKALGMSHSILVKLMHPDISKRIINPRLDTLTKIVDFFRRDGFDITVNDILHGLQDKTIEEIQTQSTHSLIVEKDIPVYSFHMDKPEPMGISKVKLMTGVKNAVGYLSDQDIEPVFKKAHFSL